MENRAITLHFTLASRSLTFSATTGSFPRLSTQAQRAEKIFLAVSFFRRFFFIYFSFGELRRVVCEAANFSWVSWACWRAGFCFKASKLMSGDVFPSHQQPGFGAFPLLMKSSANAHKTAVDFQFSQNYLSAPHRRNRKIKKKTTQNDWRWWMNGWWERRLMVVERHTFLCLRLCCLCDGRLLIKTDRVWITVIMCIYLRPIFAFVCRVMSRKEGPDGERHFYGSGCFIHGSQRMLEESWLEVCVGLQRIGVCMSFLINLFTQIDLIACCTKTQSNREHHL